jgi:hypothetical protein
MTVESHSFDVGTNPELARLAGRVRMSNRPLLLTERGEAVAVLVPLKHPKPHRRARPFTPEDDAAFLSAAGGWKGNVDVDRLKEGFAESRRVPPRDRPSCELPGR